MFILLLE